jgi:ferredoxin
VDSFALLSPPRRRHFVKRLIGAHDSEIEMARHCLSYPVRVSYLGHTHVIEVEEKETILAALERQCSVVPSMASLPSDCRRGNCLTCAARILAGDNNRKTSRDNPAVTVDDGLSPDMSDMVRSRGYLLTCSSYVTGPGLVLELGVCQEAWPELYQFGSDPSRQAVARAAVARTLRRYAERHVPQWMRDTELVLQQQQQPPVTTLHNEATGESLA